MLSRALQIQRVQERMRRSVLVRSFTSLVPVPVGGYNNLVLHMNNSQDAYITLNLQSEVLHGTVPADQIDHLLLSISQVYNRYKRTRDCITFVVRNIATISIVWVFVLFVLLMILSVAGSKALLYILISFGVVLVFLISFVVVG